MLVPLCVSLCMCVTDWAAQLVLVLSYLPPCCGFICHSCASLWRTCRMSMASWGPRAKPYGAWWGGSLDRYGLTSTASSFLSPVHLHSVSLSAPSHPWSDCTPHLSQLQWAYSPPRYKPLPSSFLIRLGWARILHFHSQFLNSTSILCNSRFLKFFFLFYFSFLQLFSTLLITFGLKRLFLLLYL